MLDVFGSVFGRSKNKSSSGNLNNPQNPPSPSTSRRNQEGSDEDQGFTFIGNRTGPSGSSSNIANNGQNPVYPTFLTDEMLRPTPPATGSSVTSHSATSTWNSHAGGTMTSGANMGHVRSNSSSHLNPLDNVPFGRHGVLASAAGFSSRNGYTSDNLGKCISTIDRVSVLIASSDYQFSLEKSVIRDG